MTVTSDGNTPIDFSTASGNVVDNRTHIATWDILHELVGDPDFLYVTDCKLASRMRYDEYRRQGLPIMTSAVESVIKTINRRVKGSEKFWSAPGAKAILQLQADYLSETLPIEWFRAEREAQASNHRPYR